MAILLDDSTSFVDTQTLLEDSPSPPPSPSFSPLLEHQNSSSTADNSEDDNLSSTSSSSGNERAVLTSWQARQLKSFLSKEFFLSDKSGKLTIKISLEGFLKRLQHIVEQKKIQIPCDGLRLVGGCASMILSLEEGNEARLDDFMVNDIDIDFHVGSNIPFFHILECEEDCLSSFLEEQTGTHLDLRTICDSFFFEMIRVNTEEESWSLITVGNVDTGFHLDLRFIEKTKRSYAFSSDSFSILLNPLFSVYSINIPNPIPFESDYGDVYEALHHLKSRKLKTKNPEQIRRGIFRICLELSKGRTFETQEEEQEMRFIFTKTFIKEFHDPDIFSTMLSKFLVKHPANELSFLNHLFQFVINSEHPKKFALLLIVMSFMQRRESTFQRLLN